MIKVLSVNKLRGKVLDYTCIMENSKEKHLSKDELVELIKQNKVSNVRLQVYQGRNIVRYKDDVTVNNLIAVPEQSSKTLKKNSTITMEEVKENTPVKEPIDIIAKKQEKIIENTPINTPVAVSQSLEDEADSIDNLFENFDLDGEEDKEEEDKEEGSSLFARIFGIGKAHHEEENDTGLGLFEEMINESKKQFKVSSK